jgi:hypothetical protein
MIGSWQIGVMWAATVFIVLASSAAAFQLALIAGAPWGELTLGGKFPGRLPGRIRPLALLSTALLSSFALIVAARAGLILPDWQGRARPLSWGVVAYCALGVLANGFTPSRKERLLWLPVVAVMFVSSLLVALS